MLWRHALVLMLVGCTPPAPPSAPSPQQPMPQVPPSVERPSSPVSFERIASFPPPGWQIPRQVRVSPDGKLVTYLQAEAGGEEMALWALDRSSGKHSVLLRAKDLVDTDKPMSREEELRRERQRKRIKGVTSYAWAGEKSVMLLPLGGNVYVRTVDGKIKQLTDSDAPDIDPQICKDGSRVAFVRGAELYNIDVASGKEAQLTKGAEGTTRGLSDFNGQEEFGEAHGFWWSPACDKLAYLEVDERKVGTIPIMGYRKQVDLQNMRYPRAGTTNPTTKLGIVDLRNRKTVWIQMPQADGIDAGDQYIGRITWSSDGKALFFQRMSRSQQRVALVRADAATGAAKHIIEEQDKTWLDFAGMRALKGNAILWTALRNGHRHIERRDATSGNVVATLTSGDWDVSEIVGVDEKRGRVLFVANKDGALDRQLYAKALDGSGGLTRLSKEGGVHDIEAGSAEHGWVDIHSSVDRTPKAVVYDPEGKAAGEIKVPLDGDFQKLRIRSPEVIKVATPGQPDMYGTLLKPRNMQEGKRYPLIVMVYGGPGVQTNRNMWNPRLLWQHLADRGFVVWQLDNRGSTGRGHAFESPIYHKLGDIELADQLRGLDHVSTLPFIDKDRVGIYGHSYGGYMAIMAMLRAPGRFKVGVSGSPVTDWRFYDTGYTERFMGTPQNNVAGYTATSLLGDADKLVGKLFIIHALMDENVHFEHTAKMIDAFVAADKDFDLLVFPGERHGYRSPKARRYAYRRVVDYFIENL